MQRYWLRSIIQGWREVSQAEFAHAEREAGFFPKPGCGPLATAGFSSNCTEGKVTYEEEKEVKIMQLKDLKPGVMFRRPTGSFRYIKSPHEEATEGCRFPSSYCYNLDGKSDGYWMPGSTEVTVIYPDSVTLSTRVKEEEEAPFYMCYVQGADSPTKKHDRTSAKLEAERLTHVTRKKVFVLKAVASVTYTPPTSSGITWIKFKKDN